MIALPGRLATLGAAFATVSLAMCYVGPQAVTAAPLSAFPRAANAKAVALRLGDVVHVLGHNITAVDARFNKANAMGECTATPPVSNYTTNFSGPVNTKGVLSVIGDVYTYGKAAGPACNQKTDMSMDKVLGATVGKLTVVRGVGTSAFILDSTGPKSPGPPVYTLAIKFTRGLYRAIIVVQSNKTIKSVDMVKLGQIVDHRMQRAT